MKKNNLIDWFLGSNRWKHFVGGLVLGFLLTFFCALGAGGGMEYKDRAYGGQWDWTDLLCTIAGGLLGQALQVLLIWLIFF